MINENEFTYFASPGRLELDEVRIQAVKILESPEFKRLTDALPDIFMILNTERQIVFANSRLTEFLRLDNIDEILGKRPGEALKCIRANETIGGCGTTENCILCGAARSIVEGLNGQFNVRECKILVNSGTDAFDLKVWSSPYLVHGEKYTVFAVQNISDEKRRSVLERVFFHDIINILGGLRGLTEVLKYSPEYVDDYKDSIYGLTEALIDEINAQKQLLAAESNELAVNIQTVNSYKLIQSVVGFYQKHHVTHQKHIEISPDIINTEFQTDEILAKRIIGNMLKNALESTPKDGTVTLSAYKEGETVVITVNNPTVMPREIQLQMFLRSFSTKGQGRGLGTYSMKILMEKYLKGKIDFKSVEGEGTTFFACFLQ